jgi:hypothetical protein
VRGAVGVKGIYEDGLAGPDLGIETRVGIDRPSGRCGLTGGAELEIAVDGIGRRPGRFGPVIGDIEIEVVDCRTVVFQNESDFPPAIILGIGAVLVHGIGELLDGDEAAVVPDDAGRVRIEGAG